MSASEHSQTRENAAVEVRIVRVRVVLENLAATSGGGNLDDDEFKSSDPFGTKITLVRTLQVPAFAGHGGRFLSSGPKHGATSLLQGWPNRPARRS